jgi:broad specificity phosphatase PhoE
VGYIASVPSGYFITHPDVTIDPAKPIERWGLSPRGRERMRAVLGQPWLRQVGCVLSSSEQKALDGAEILLSALAVPHRVVPELGEYDRSSTGLLPPDEFLQLVDEFFRWPERSIRGWEPAAHAQSRVLAAVRAAAANWHASAPDAQATDLAFVAHGAVGALLLAHLSGAAISRDFAQPSPAPGSPPGSGGGNYFRFALRSLELEQGWRAIDAD